MSRILLVNPWIYDFAAFDLWQKPLGLLYIGAILQKAGHTVSLLDCLDRYHPDLFNFTGIDHVSGERSFGVGKYIKTEVVKPSICAEVLRHYSRYGTPLSVVQKWLSIYEKPDIVLITSGMTYWYPGVQHIIQLIKEQYPGVPVILGGIYATLCYEHAREFSGADYVVSGECEQKILEIIQNWIPLNNQSYCELKNLDDFFYPCLDFYPQLKSIPLLTSRGCPFHCTFCASHLLNGKFRQRNPNAVVEEVHYWWTKKHVYDIAFFDDALLVNSHRHFLPLMEGIAHLKIPFRFHTPNGISPAFIDRNTAYWMKKGGFVTIRLSLETISPGFQEDIQKKVSADTFTNAVDYLETAGFLRNQIGAYILMGLPGQTINDVLDTIFFVTQHGVKIKLAQFSPIPGTKAWEKEMRLNNITENFDPLLTNDTLLPMRSKIFTWEIVRWIKNIVVILNKAADNGIQEVEKILASEGDRWRGCLNR